MSSKKLLLRKKIVKKSIKVYKTFLRVKSIDLSQWKKRLAIVHSFSDEGDSANEISTFVDGYLSYNSHFIFFEIISESEWNPEYYKQPIVRYNAKWWHHRSLKWACHVFKIHTRCEPITSTFVRIVLQFIEKWMDENNEMIEALENHCFKLPKEGLMIKQDVESEEKVSEKKRCQEPLMAKSRLE